MSRPLAISDFLFLFSRPLMPIPAMFGSPASHDYLGFVCDVLGACGGARKHEKQGVAAPLWDYHLPQAKPIVEMIRGFVRNSGRLDAEINGQVAGWARLGEAPPIVASNGIEIRVEYSIFGGSPQTYLAMQTYPSRAASDLCHGQWATFGMAQARCPGSLMPLMAMEGDSAVIRWDKPLVLQLSTNGFFGLWKRLSLTTIDAVRLGPDDGELITTGLPGWTLPRLVWSKA